MGEQVVMCAASVAKILPARIRSVASRVSPTAKARHAEMTGAAVAAAPVVRSKNVLRTYARRLVHLDAVMPCAVRMTAV